LNFGNISGEGEGEVAEVGTTKEEESRVFNFFYRLGLGSSANNGAEERRKNIGLFEE
jgi:hypothetical protein